MKAVMILEYGRAYEFGPFRLDTTERRLTRLGQAVPLTPKAFDTLVQLVQNSGHLLEKSELMKRLWPDTFVEDFTLTRNIADVRKALGDGTNGVRYIETVPKRGYRFVAEVRKLPQQVAVRAIEAPMRTVARWPPKALLMALAGLVCLLAGTGVALSWLHRPQTISGIRSLAVLPFKSLQPGERDRVLELGLADTLISRLSNISEVSVRSMATVHRYFDQVPDPLTAGRRLRVDAVLEGTIHKQDGAFRVTVRLLHVRDGKAVWTGTFDEQPAGLFALEDSVASQVATAISARLNQANAKLLTRHPTESAEAHKFYMKARYFWARRDREALQKAVGYFEQAISKDPAYASAYAGLADSLLLVGGYSYSPQKDVMARTRTAVEKALQLDDSLAEAHTTLALIHQNYDWDWSETEREYHLAIQSNANYPTAHGRFAEFLAHMGRFEEAFKEMERALQLDPVSLILNSTACKILSFAREYDKAIEQCKRVLELDPHFVQAHDLLVGIYLTQNAYEDALAEAQKLRQIEDSPRALAILGEIYAAMGDRKAALKCREILDARATREYVSPFWRLGIPIYLGDYEEALRWLEKTYDARAVGLIILKVAPVFDPLRDDPRFKALMRKMNF